MEGEGDAESWDNPLSLGVKHVSAQSDSLLCEHTTWDVHDFLHYDYVGAPWRQVSRFPTCCL